MICSSCRKEIKGDSDFCPFCGTQVLKKMDGFEMVQGALSNLFSQVTSEIKNEFLGISKNEKESVHFDPFLFEVDQGFLSSLGVVEVLGEIVDGRVSVGDKLFFLDTNFNERYVVVKKIEQDGKSVPFASKGEVRLSFVEEDAQYLEIGLIVEKNYTYHKVLKLEIYVQLASNEDVLRIQKEINSSVEICFDHQSFLGNIISCEGVCENTMFLIISFAKEIVVRLGLVFSLKENGRTIGEGKIIKVFE